MTDLTSLNVAGVPVFGGLGISALRKVYFVDNTFGSDGNKGLSVKRPFFTIQKAFSKVQDNDTIIVMRGSYDEQLITSVYSNTSNMQDGRGRYVNLIGATDRAIVYDSPQLFNVSGDTATLFIRSPGWRVSGFRILGDSGSPIGLKTEMAGASPTTQVTVWAPGLQIDNVNFYGATGSHKGLEIKANGDMAVLNCYFEQFAVLAAFEDVGGGFTFPQARVLNNIFRDNAVNIDVPFQVSQILYNMIGGNKLNAMTRGIDMRGGSSGNNVNNNMLSGVYKNFTNAGNYEAGAGTDNWAGNYHINSTGNVTVNVTTGVPTS